MVVDTVHGINPSICLRALNSTIHILGEGLSPGGDAIPAMRGGGTGSVKRDALYYFGSTTAVRSVHVVVSSVCVCTESRCFIALAHT